MNFEGCICNFIWKLDEDIVFKVKSVSYLN